MKNIILVVTLLFLSANSLFAEVVIDKENCTITKDGEVFPLYGEVVIVDSFADIEVKIVESFGDIDIKLVDSFANNCGEVKIVKSFAPIKVKIVDSFADIDVKIVDDFPGF